MPMSQLCQIVAVEKKRKAATTQGATVILRAAKDTNRYNGFSKKFFPKVEGGENFPGESKKVQVTVDTLIGALRKNVCDSFDITATKDFGNTEAKADVVLDGHVLVKDVPIPYLLYLEKNVTHMHTVIEALPVLDPNENWEFDENASLWKTEPVRVARTKKVQKPIVLYDATEHHPAQTQLISEDVSVGEWETVCQSGAIPKHVKDQYLANVRKVLEAIVSAREKANSTEVENKYGIGDAIFDSIFTL